MLPQPHIVNFILIAHHLGPGGGARVDRLRRARERGFICVAVSKPSSMLAKELLMWLSGGHDPVSSRSPTLWK